MPFDPALAAPRADASLKGNGFLGVMKRPDGGVMSEYSIPMDEENGDYRDIPSFVPTLSKKEVQHLLSMNDGDPFPQSVAKKAVAFAKQREKAGLPFFAQNGEEDLTIHPDLPRAATTGPGATFMPTSRDDGSMDSSAFSQALRNTAMAGHAPMADQPAMASHPMMQQLLELAAKGRP
jgi:hypothetical protein